MKSKVKELLKKLLILFGSLFKIKNVIIFESHADYSDSSRTFSEYLVENGYNKKYKIYWFVNDASKYKDRECYNVKFLTMWRNKTHKSLSQWICYFWIVKNAKYLIFSNRTLTRINRKTITININHGIAIKSIKNHRTIPYDIDIRIDSSEFCAKLVMDQQGLRRDQVVILGNPRNDVIFKETNIKDKVPEFMSYSKRILWLPTFRQSALSNRVDSTFNFPLGIPIVYDMETLEDLNKYLKRRNMILILKLHPAQDLSKLKATSLSNILILDDEYLITRNVELTEFYKITDALLTDYSSVYVDYLLTQNPIGFTVDDFKQYKNGFSMDNIQAYMPGEKIKNYKDLKAFIDHLDKGKDDYREERIKINKVFNEFVDGDSSKRLAEFLNL